MDLTPEKQVAQAMIAERDHFRQILDSQFGFVCVLTPQGVLTEVNATVLKLSGRTREDLIGQNFWEIGWIEQESQAYVRHCISVASQGTTIRREIRRSFPAVGCLDVDTVFYPLRDASKNIIGVVLFGVDISELKRVSSEIDSQKLQLAESQRNAKIGSWELDLKSNRLKWSDETYRIFEIDPNQGEANYENFLNVVHPDDRERVNSVLSNLYSMQTPCYIEHRLLMKDGRIKHMVEHCQTEFGSDGNPVRCFGTLQDITSRKQTENAFLERELYWQSFINLPKDAFFIYEKHQGLRIIDVNHEACRSLGYAREELIGKSLADIDLFTTEDLIEGLSQKLEAGEVVTLDTRYQRQDGSTYPVEVHIRQFSYHDRLRSVVLARDLSERKEIEKRSRDLQDTLAHAYRFKSLGEVTSGLAHELNQPLAAIHLNADTARFLAEKSDSPILRTCLEQIVEQSFRAGEIIRRMRTFIRKDTKQRAACEINSLLNDVLLFTKDYLLENRIEIKLALATKLPRVNVEAIQIQQVLINLIQNAVDAIIKSSNNKRVIAITTKLAFPTICVSVHDSGQGIDAEIADKLFMPFQTTKPTGLGLGLSICRTIVEAHGGEIDCQRDGGSGTCFSFTLPIKQ